MSRNDIRYTEKFYSKEFSDGESKNAYLKACKWLAKYVLSKKEFNNVEFGIEKVKEGGVNDIASHTFRLSLYAVLSEEELRERHCEICKETHKSFFISEETNCEWCRLKAYYRRTDDVIGVKIRYYKECLGRYVEDVR